MADVKLFLLKPFNLVEKMCSSSLKNAINKTGLLIYIYIFIYIYIYIYIYTYIYIQDLTLNNPHWLICHETKPL